MTPREGRRSGRARAAAGAVVALLAACAPPPEPQPLSNAGHLTLDADPTALPWSAAPSGPPAPTVTVTRAPQDRAGGQVLLSQRSAPVLAADPSAGAPAPQGPPVSFNLAEASVPDAAQAILGDVLGLPFVVDPGVGGAITLRADTPVPRQQLLDSFAAALDAQGLALAFENGIWRVSAAGAGRPGQQVFLPRHLGAAELATALELALPAERIRLVRAGAGEAVVVSGDARELDLARQTAAAVDREALAGMSLVLVGLEYASPGDLADEVAAIFGGDAAPALGAEGVAPVPSGALRVVPIERLGAVALLARDPATLDRASALIRRLDRPRAGDETRLFIYRVQNRSAEALAEALSGLFSGAAAIPADPAEADVFDPYLPAQPKVVVDKERNALVISAPNDQFGQVVDLIRQLDAAPMQVLVEATLLEVALGDNLRYGVQYAFQTGELFDGREGLVNLTEGSSALIRPTLPGFAFSIGTSLAPEIIIEALDEITNVRVVSSPKLLVRDNQSATLQIGDQVPIISQQAEGLATNDRIVNTIEYRDTGVTLTVTPRINSGGLVSLAIQQEVSAVGETTTSDIDSPTFSRRSITTDVTVQSGQLVVLGGLIQDRTSTGRAGIPVAQDIPVVGALFGTRGQTASRSELLALLRPHILSSPAQAADITESLRRDFEAIAAASGRAPAIRRVERVKLPIVGQP